MHQAPTILVIILGLSGFLSIYLAAWAQLRSRVLGAKEFSVSLFAIAIYSLGYAIEISRVDLTGILEAVRLEYIGIAIIPAMTIIFVLRITQSKLLRWYVVAPLFIVPVIALILLFTMKYHNLYYINPRVVEGEFFPVIVFERGVWYYIAFAYMQISLVLSSILLIVHAFHSGKRIRRQSILLAVGSFFPLVGSILYFLNLIPGKIDPGPFALTLSSLFFSAALFKFGLFELVPAARELALDSIHDSLLVVDKQGRLQDLNKAAWRLPGAMDLQIGDTLPFDNPLTACLRPLLEETKDNIEFSAIDPETGVHYFSAKAYKLLDNFSQFNGIAVLMSDITETRGYLKQLSHQANTDELTGLLNRRHLMKLGIQEIDMSRCSGLPLGIILVDLDHFKLYNDRYGHVEGDAVLRNVAQCFQKGLRNVDILGRYGGEEFVVFLPGADLNTAIQVAERLKQQLADWVIMIKDERLNVTASFGVYSVIANEQTTIDELLKKADWALYQAKDNGRNQVGW